MAMEKLHEYATAPSPTSFLTQADRFDTWCATSEKTFSTQEGLIMALKCAICSSPAEKHGGVIIEEGKTDEPQIVCHLHLNRTGDQVKEGEVKGEWRVVQTWGYESADTRVKALFDNGMERYLHNSEEGSGWKIVAKVGEVSLEVSSVPQRKGWQAPGPGPVPPPPGPSPELTNEAIHEGIDWKHKVNDENVPAGPQTAWAWGWMQDQDGSQTPIQKALTAAIGPAKKAELVIGEMTYTIGGRDNNLFNRKRKKET